MGKTYEIPKGAPEAKCRGCDATIFWVKTENGKNMPVDPDGTPHWGTCSKADRFNENGPFIDIVFSDHQESESPEFVEVEDSQGRSMSLGSWLHRADGYWVLRVRKSALMTKVDLLRGLLVEWARLVEFIPLNDHTRDLVSRTQAQVGKR